MPLYAWIGIAFIAGVSLIAGLVLVAWRLRRREPYAAFLRLGVRQKLRFFRAAMADRRVPLRVKAIPLVLAIYLALPFDLIPDFIPVLGYVDDVAIVLIALAAMIRLTPREVIDELIASAEAD